MRRRRTNRGRFKKKKRVVLTAKERSRVLPQAPRVRSTPLYAERCVKRQTLTLLTKFREVRSQTGIRTGRVTGSSGSSASAARRARIARITLSGRAGFALSRRARRALRISARSVHHHDFVRWICIDNGRSGRSCDGSGAVVAGSGRSKDRDARTVAREAAGSALATDEHRGSEKYD